MEWGWIFTKRRVSVEPAHFSKRATSSRSSQGCITQDWEPSESRTWCWSRRMAVVISPISPKSSSSDRRRSDQAPHLHVFQSADHSALAQECPTHFTFWTTSPPLIWRSTPPAIHSRNSSKGRHARSSKPWPILQQWGPLGGKRLNEQMRTLLNCCSIGSRS